MCQFLKLTLIEQSCNKTVDNAHLNRTEDDVPHFQGKSIKKMDQKTERVWSPQPKIGLKYAYEIKTGFPCGCIGWSSSARTAGFMNAGTSICQYCHEEVDIHGHSETNQGITMHTCWTCGSRRHLQAMQEKGLLNEEFVNKFIAEALGPKHRRRRG